MAEVKSSLNAVLINLSRAYKVASQEYRIIKEKYHEIIGEKSSLDNQEISDLQSAIAFLYDNPRYLRLSSSQKSENRATCLKATERALGATVFNRNSTRMWAEIPKIPRVNPYKFSSEGSGDVPLEIQLTRLCRTRAHYQPRHIRVLKMIATRFFMRIPNRALSPEITRRLVRAQLGDLEERAYENKHDFWVLGQETAIFPDKKQTRPLVFIPGFSGYDADESSLIRLMSFPIRR